MCVCLYTFTQTCISEPVYMTCLARPNQRSQEVEVEDWDLVSGNDFMGACRLQLNQVHDRTVHQVWLPLTGNTSEDDSDRGRLELAVRWIHSPELKPCFFHEDDDRPGKLANEIRVAVIRARKLPIMDRNLLSRGGSSDPFVRLTFAPPGNANFEYATHKVPNQGPKEELGPCME